jgi:hypothetical protein
MNVCAQLDENPERRFEVDKADLLKFHKSQSHQNTDGLNGAIATKDEEELEEQVNQQPAASGPKLAATKPFCTRIRGAPDFAEQTPLGKEFHSQENRKDYDSL